MKQSASATTRALKDLGCEEPLRFRVEGECMSPLANHGAWVEISPAGFYWPGDVIAFQAEDGRLLLHRLIGYWPRPRPFGLLTQADASRSYEAAFDPGRVIGKVRGGECSPLLVKVPFRHRLWAVSRFFSLAFSRCLARLL